MFSVSFSRLLVSLWLVAVAAGLGACGEEAASAKQASAPTAEAAEQAQESEEPSSETLYQRGLARLEAGAYEDAAEAFDELERQRPYSRLAPLSQIMSGYAHYRARAYEAAIVTLKRFIERYPTDRLLAYAHYLEALCYYERISDVGRDQGMTRQAKQALQRLIRRFPASKYAQDARLKLDLTNNHLAGKDMRIGRYYLERLEYLAAAGRFRHVIEAYETTSHTPEALHRLVEIYLILGVEDEAKRYGAVLGHNFPESAWYRRSYRLLHDTDPPPQPPEAQARGARDGQAPQAPRAS